MKRDWLARWENGHTGWHQPKGNAALRKFWPQPGQGARVLVPLCGKSPDLLWLAEQGCEVTGVELSGLAIRAFFEETGIRFECSRDGRFERYRASGYNITLVCGDYFQFSAEPFDALYDRAALVALPPDLRPAYVRHTKSLLKPAASLFLLTLEYDQSQSSGPPFSVMPDEVTDYWPRLERVGERIDPRNFPQKFREAGLSEITEAVWVA